eukprot:Phypoly_transcript_08576.p1 GENE.Phypoly_transcript_08576~~Phypoly_transcript_08576.p1  ORF type:complete len:354 (+),score=44.01 Phypoly_transcript_08576:43-1104(+)
MTQIVTHTHKSIAFTAYDVKWVPESARFVSVGGTARGSGTIKIWELNKTDLNLVSEFEKPASFKCSSFAASSKEERHLATGDFNGKLGIWDLEKGTCTTERDAHTEIINTVDGCGGIRGVGAVEIATGSRDGKVKVWDPRQSGAVACFEPGSSGSDSKTKSDCWAVAFGNAYENWNRDIAAGYSTGELKIFDLRTLKERWSTKLANGICSVQFDRKDIAMNKMVVTTLDGKFYIFDLRTFHSTKGYSYSTEKAHDSTIWCVQHSPFNRDVFITCGGNGSVNLYKYTYPAQRSKKDSKGIPYGIVGSVTCVVSSQVAEQPIISYDWNLNFEGLACGAALDQTLKVIVVPKLHLV